jgi:hypothetical protein
MIGSALGRRHDLLEKGRDLVQFFGRGSLWNWFEGSRATADA